MARGRRRWSFYASLPERVARTVAAGLGGTLHESFELTLPRVIRRSRLYEATAKNLLRVVIELVGGVRDAPTVEPGTEARELAKRKGAGNVMEIGSIAAFGFSPIWLLAGASDLTHGSRVYLAALTDELKAAGLLGEDVHPRSVDGLLQILERTSGGTARLIDLPPLELRELRASLAELRSDATSLPSAEELQALYAGLRRTAAAENRPLIAVSAGIGLAFLTAARKVSEAHVVVPYRHDWEPVRDEGFAAYARRVGEPYRRAVAEHLDAARPSGTERALERIAAHRARRREARERRA